MRTERVHGSAVAFGNFAVLIRGESGSGKTTLALRLIEHGAMLVADDAVEIDTAGMVSAPREGAGRIEAYGSGIVTHPYRRSAQLRLVVALGQDADRLPEAEARYSVAGLEFALLRLAARDAGNDLHVLQALRRELTARSMRAGA